jgi:hypothetical protein
MPRIAIERRRSRGLQRHERCVVLDIWRGRVRRDGGWIGVDRGIGTLLGEPMEGKSRRKNARTGGRGRVSAACLPIGMPNSMRGLSDVAWEASLSVIRLR